MSDVETKVEEAKPEALDEYEQSAAYIYHLSKAFRQIGYKLADRKKRSPIRVLEAVLFEPLEAVELVGQEEKDLFAICQEVLYHKNKLVEYMLTRKENKEKLNESEEK